MLVGGCKSLSGSMFRWVFGDRLRSWLTAAQIDEVMVMDGGNKGLDVLSSASDEAGMNHPSEDAERGAAPSPEPRHPTPASASLCSFHLSAPVTCHHHQKEAALDPFVLMHA